MVSLFAGHPKRDSFNKVVRARQSAQPSTGQPPTETASTVTIGEHKNKKARTDCQERPAREQESKVRKAGTGSHNKQL